jgi:hypothetical protein
MSSAGGVIGGPSTRHCMSAKSTIEWITAEATKPARELLRFTPAFEHRRPDINWHEPAHEYIR